MTLEQLRARLEEIHGELRGIDTEAGDLALTDEQNTRFDALMAERADVEGKIGAEEARAATRERLAAAVRSIPAQRSAPTQERTLATEHGDGTRGAGAPGRQARAQVVEPLTYNPHSRNSYFLDLARSQVNGDLDARERLQRHAREMDVEVPRRDRAREARARQQLHGIPGLSDEDREAAFEQRVNPNRTDGQGGYFVPPVYLTDQYADLPRFGRTAANLAQGFDLPGGTDSINIPKVSTGTATAVQASDAASVSSTDLTDSIATAPVRTIAGQQDVALQLLDQSPIAFDQVIFQDLLADLNARIDVQVINGSGSSGQVTGILNVSGINSVTYTDASPTLPEMYPSFAQGASLVFKNRKLAATGALVYPSTWYWATGQLDTTNRPLIVPPSIAFNASGTASDVGTDEAPAGMLALGLPVYLDGNIPTTLGGGTETRAIVARWSDLYLWEGSTQTRVVEGVLSGTLQVRLQAWKYVAFMGDRRPSSISVLSGTGMIPQSGY
jgi:HK97 family phage major capsid protein